VPEPVTMQDELRCVPHRQSRPARRYFDPVRSPSGCASLERCVTHARNHHYVSACYLKHFAVPQGDRFQIGNNRGGINGWLTHRQIFGRLVAVAS
jgi:hypothetical protein